MSAAQDNEKTIPRIGVYRLEEEIGAGAMGKVYRAIHETLGKAVALKIVHADDPSGEVGARFLQEGIAASRVRHPNVVEILDAGTHEGTAFMAMQLLDGETLAECLSRQGRIPQTYAVDLLLPVCAALSAAHDAGVLHRDLKPANIFLSDVGRGDPEPILLDFGISKILGPVDPELTQNPRFLGSPLYIAPEQADGASGSALSDQYSLALTLYEALLGVRPFAKYSSSLIQLLRHVAEGNIRRPSELDASIPDELDAAVCRALSTNPRHRFPSVREFGAALLPFASQARRTLWQQSFTDAERTMTSANAPVSDSIRSSRKVEVSLEAAPSTDPSVPTLTETDGADSQDDFVSHSSLFGDTDTDSLRPDAAQSSISRRDPFSQSPSVNSSGSWNKRESSSFSSLDRKTLETPVAESEQKAQGPSQRSLTWGFALVGLVLAVLFALRPWSEASRKTFEVGFSVTPADATIRIDGQNVGKGRFVGEFPLDGRAHRARFQLSGHEPVTVVFRDEAPVEAITLAPLATPVGAAQLPPIDETPNTEPRVEKEAAGEPSSGNSPAQAQPEKLPATNSQAARPTPSVQAASTKPSSAPPSDPPTEEVSTEVQGASTALKEETNPPKAKEVGKPSLHTGNLDPWAQ